MKRKLKKYQMRLSILEARALTLLAQREGVTKAAYLTAYIRREAKKKGIPV